MSRSLVLSIPPPSRAFSVRVRTQLRWSSTSRPSAPSTKYRQPKYTFAGSSESLPEATPHTRSVLEQNQKYILGVYARPDFVLSHGKGMRVYDTEGREFLDFSAGIAVNSLGHADPGVVQTLTEQAAKIIHASNVLHNEWAGKLAQLLVTLTAREGGLGYSPGSSVQESDVPKVFFSNSGTEANEGALKIARKVGKDRGGASKTGIVCFKGGFHGRSMGALSVTSNPKYQEPFKPLIPGVAVGKLNDYQSVGLIDENTCAVIVEPIQGEGGVNECEVGWLRELRKRCDETGSVLIFDEIQCGLYRAGSLWAHSRYPTNCHPDIVTMAKPLANGYPIGAVLMREEIARTMTIGTHGTTFGGSPLACSLGYHVMSRLSDPAFARECGDASAYLMRRLERLPEWFPELLQPKIRGRGLIVGLGFKQLEDGLRNPNRLVELARERGLFLLTAGKDAVRIVPSLILSKEDVDEGVDVIESCLAEMRDS